MAKEADRIVFLDARLQDVESLSTIVPRCLFAVNPRMEELLPDTPAVRAWWGRIFEDLINDPHSHLPIAIDPFSNTVIGAIMLDAVLQGQPSGGVLMRHPPTEDHNAEAWTSVVEAFAQTEKRVVGDRDRFLVEIMGVDSDYQGMGVGKRLVATACEIADAKGLPIFLKTSAAREYYLKQGLGFGHVSEEDNGGGKGDTILREPVAVAK